MATRLEQVEQFERKIGSPLPADYRQFLLSGPFPVWEGECDPENEATYILFALHDLEDLLTSWNENERDKSLPDWFLEVGEIYDGVKLGIKLRGNQVGSIHTFSWDDGEPTFHADSFQKFLDALYADGASFDSPVDDE